MRWVRSSNGYLKTKDDLLISITVLDLVHLLAFFYSRLILLCFIKVLCLYLCITWNLLNILEILSLFFPRYIFLMYINLQFIFRLWFIDSWGICHMNSHFLLLNIILILFFQIGGNFCSNIFPLWLRWKGISIIKLWIWYLLDRTKLWYLRRSGYSWT